MSRLTNGMFMEAIRELELNAKKDGLSREEILETCVLDSEGDDICLLKEVNKYLLDELNNYGFGAMDRVLKINNKVVEGYRVKVLYQNIQIK